MLDVSIVNETSPEANWNGQADRQADRQTNLCVGRLRLQKDEIQKNYLKKLFMAPQLSMPEKEFDVMKEMYTALGMRTCSEKTTF